MSVPAVLPLVTPTTPTTVPMSRGTTSVTVTQLLRQELLHQHQRVQLCHLHNGGTCIDGINSYTCNCTSGWTNTSNCMEDINECTLQDPCLNGATCVNTEGSFSCQCEPGSQATCVPLRTRTPEDLVRRQRVDYSGPGGGGLSVVSSHRCNNIFKDGT